MKAYCICCGRYRRVRVKKELTEALVRGIPLVYYERRAFCRRCGKEVYSPEVNDKNCAARLRAFQVGMH